MASLSAVIGIFKKRKIDAFGNVTTERVPFLPKTLAKLVYLLNGESVEHAVQRQDNQVATLNNKVQKISTGEAPIPVATYPSLEDYKAAIEAGTASKTSIYAIED